MATSSPGKKRQFVYLPEISPGSFLLFFQKGAAATSWSLRDYSRPGHVKVYYATDFGWDAAKVYEMAETRLDAPAIPTTNLDFWHEKTVQVNREHNLTTTEPAPISGEAARQKAFPLLAEDELLRLSKARKPQDMLRIRTSPNSEDWVTWNFLRLLQDARPESWPQTLDETAGKFNPQARLGLSADQHTRFEFWRPAASPAGYERLSRQRMLDSGVKKQVDRAYLRGPVEGDSEIDVLVESPRFLVFLEAKLGSDISLKTTYDPGRNQIARNIDCLIEQAGDREPIFWMLVRDTNPSRSYVQLIERYRSSPELLMRELPHRDEKLLRRLAVRLSIIRWQDLGEGWIGKASADPLSEAVRLELLRRIGIGAATHEDL